MGITRNNYTTVRASTEMTAYQSMKKSVFETNMMQTEKDVNKVKVFLEFPDKA